MEYTVLRLGKLAGISPRTLRYYDEIGLLKPKEVTEAGYRVYGEKEADALLQILYYRELDMPLTRIKEILNAPAFDRLKALDSHLKELTKRRDRLNHLIESAKRTILHEKGCIKMSDREKFEAFKKDMIRDNEEKYGKEARQKYGDRQVEESNARMMNMTKEEYDAMQKLGEDILSGLQKAVLENADPAGAQGQRLAKMHRDWLSYTWGGRYTKEGHLGLTGMYVEDERFTAYYDSKVKGCAAFLRDAVAAYVKE